MNRAQRRRLDKAPKSEKEKDEKYLARYNMMYDKFFVMSLDKLKEIQATQKMSANDQHALRNAIFNKEHPVNETQFKMVEDANAYDLQSDAVVGNIACLREPTDDFIYATIGLKEIEAGNLNDKYMPTMLTDTWFEYFKFEQKNDRWEKEVEGVLFYSEKTGNVLICRAGDKTLNYVHQLQNHWGRASGQPLVNMHKTLTKSLSI